MTTFLTHQIENNICFLTEIDSHHAIKALRMKNQDICSVINGKGVFAKGEIIDANSKKTKIKIHELKKIKKPVTLSLAFCPTKNNDRNSLIIEKATEIGVTEITPIICCHSERKAVKIDRFEKKIQSAMKQSLISLTLIKRYYCVMMTSKHSGKKKTVN